MLGDAHNSPSSEQLFPAAATLGFRYDTGHGFMFQMPAAYSAMVRSLENFPELATFKIAFCAHPSGSEYSFVKRWSASK